MQDIQVEISCEAPVSIIKLVQQLTQLDFVIASYALEVPGYAEAYRTREEGRICILDNGFFEVGYALTELQLLHAAQCVNADYLILPDEKNPHKALAALTHWASTPYQLAVVVHGDTPLQMFDFYQTICASPHLRMVCWPFRGPRMEALHLYGQCLKRNALRHRHHLLGVSSCEELARCVQAFPRGTALSVDTMKPVSAAFKLASFEVKGSLRGKYPRPSLMALRAPRIEHYLALNIKTLQGVAHGLVG